MRKRAMLDATRAELDRAERRVAAAEADARRLRAALDVLPLAVVVRDETGAEIARNSEAARLAEALGSDALAWRSVLEMLEASPPRPRSETLDLHGPPPRTLVVSAWPLLEDGTVTGTAAVVEDITQFRHVDAVRRDFVANVSHELRTPIGALTALSDALADETDIAVVHRLTARVSAEALRASRLIDELLDLSRIEAGQPQLREVRARDLVDAAVARVAATAEDRATPIDVAPVPDAVMVLADEAQLVSAIANLVDNAVKYSEPGSAVRVGVLDDESEVRVVVSDRGIGIPTRDRDRIFERFYRVDRARSRETGGTGLGLAIVRHVALNHGGDVEVESREGEGSTFTIRIPRRRDATP